MPLPLPNLDNRTFADLTLELRSLIPRYDKAWTNHNPSDPGITLIELFAWLAEMLMYRMNRIEKGNYLTFLDLIGVKPSGPRTIITFEIKISKAALPTDFVLLRGTRVSAREERTGEEIVFETTVDVPYSEESWDEDREIWVFKAPAVNTMVIEKELLGVSNGSSRQTFSLKWGPLFLDREEESYAGNPKVTVESPDASVTWTYKTDLLSSGSGDEHFTAELLAGLIRFGDGTNGTIPPAGSKILCTYRRLGGPSGNVVAKKLTTLIDSLDGIGASAISVFNEYAATGGLDGETLDDLLARGLGSLHEPYRAVSDEDFESLARQAAPDKVARVKVVADRNLEGTTPDEEGHISVIVLPALEQLGLPELPAQYDAVTKKFTLNRRSAAVTNALRGIPVKKLNWEILRYLDERRLITTIVHVVGPSFTIVRLNVTFQAKPGVNAEAVKQAVGEALAAFLDPYEGWKDQQGWPYGRDLYRSELYQLIESIEGVDHVTALQMKGDATATATVIPVGENSLVGLDELTVTVF